MNESVKNEATFIPDVFRSSFVLEGNRALAKRVQTLMLMEPGTIPNLCQAGINIRKYLEDIADDITLKEVDQDINVQIAKYLPNQEIKAIKSSIVDIDGSKTLAIFFSVKSTGTAEDISEFALTFYENNSSGRVISEVYF